MDGFEKVKLGKANDGIDFLKNEAVLSNLSRSNNFIKGFNNQNIKPIFENKEKVEKAQIETASNTAEIKMDLKTVIENQNNMIKILQTQLSDLNLTLDLIFGSVYDVKDISEEALKLFSEINMKLYQGKKPDLKAFFADKSSDVIIQVFFLIINGVLKQLSQGQ